MTNRFTLIGVEILGAKLGAARNRLISFFAGNITFLRPARINLSALSQNVEVGLAIGGLIGNRYIVNATLMLTILS